MTPKLSDRRSFKNTSSNEVTEKSTKRFRELKKMSRSISAAVGPALLLCLFGGALSTPQASAEEYYTKKFESFPKCCSVLRNHTKKMNESGQLSTKVIDNSSLFVGMTFNGLPQFYSCTPTADGGGVLGSNRADKQLGLTLAE